MHKRHIVTLLCAALVSTAAPGAAVAVASHDLPPPLVSPGKPAPVPQDPPYKGPLGRMKDSEPSGLTRPQEQALATAQSRAETTGKPAPVDALTNETDTVTANPGGTVTWTTSVLPERVRKNGVWTRLDSTLRENADGSYSPTASTGSLTFSGGGDGPLVRMKDGKAALALSWPTSLPTPKTSGPDITYPEVLPGVDLVLTANTRGGFTQVLVVKSAAAAAHPGLATLKLGVRATGVKLAEDKDDNLRAKSPDGRVVFSAPQPHMWDSSTASTTAPGATSKSAPKSAAPASLSSRQGPAGGAKSARVRVDVSASALTLVPDAKLLKATSTRYPVYIDPSWNPHPANGSRQHFVGVQEGCPTAKNYDSTTYGNPGVGMNSWSGCIGRERAYFQIGIPSAIWKTNIVSAVANVQETSSSSCSESSSVTLYTANAFSANTSWSSRPGLVTALGSRTFGPACSSYVSGGYAVTSAIAKAAAGRAGSWTFALLNGNESSGVYMKRFSPSPTVSITYNHVPYVPSGLAATVNAASYGCDVAAPYPVIGKTVATTPPMLTAVVGDADRDALAAKFTYWVDGSSTKATLTSPDVASGKRVQVQLPASFVSGLKDGSTVAWQVLATDGKDTATNPSVCRFTVDQRAPAKPAVESQGLVFPERDQGAAAGTEGTFVARVAPGSTNNTAAKFVFGLDVKPPTSNPPASQVVAAVNNSASYKVRPPAPGTHTLWVYALDAAGNASEMYPYEFIALGHAPRTYASLKDAFNNTAVSSDSNPAPANIDSYGNSFSLQDLQAAGWKPGEKITVNGATFTLPAFGTGAPDNVMAANQTIRMNGATGNALVFLATATQARTALDRNPADATSPVVPDGTTGAGTNCVLTNGLPTDCEAATGAITYSGSPAPSPYYLSVPDWSTGPGTLATVTLPHRNRPAGGQEARPVKIYTFSVPLRPGVAVDSVTLPDVNDKATLGIPGLHIFGMAVRDTGKATGGSSWKGAWGAPVEGIYNYNEGGGDFTDQTFRVVAAPSISGTARFRLSNAHGLTPLVIDHATYALSAGDGAQTEAPPVDLAFDGGKRSVIIPAGGEVFTDPTSTSLPARKGAVISFHLANKVKYLPQHSWVGNTGIMYVTPPGSGDRTADKEGTAFSGDGVRRGRFINILTEIDVLGGDGKPTVAVLGDGLVDPFSGGTPVQGGVPRLPEWLAWNLGSDASTAGVGVVASGIENNRLTVDGTQGGDAALSRLDRDVLSVPGVKTVVIYEGLRDLLAGTDDIDLTSTYALLRGQLTAWGIKVVFTTLTPCHGYAPCTSAVDLNRLNVNSWVSEQQDFTGPYVDHVDIEAAVAVPDPSSPLDPPSLRLRAEAAPGDHDAGDHVNLTRNGYLAAANAFGSEVLDPEVAPGGAS